MNKGLSVFTGIASLLLLSSCVKSTAPTDEIPAAEAQPAEGSLVVVTTFLPMTQFAEAVGGDRIILTQLLPSNVDPHDYQAKPQDIQRLATADVLIENGLELESFLEDLITNADNPALSIVDTSVGIATLSTAENKEEAHEKGEHEDDEHHEDEHHEDEHHEDESHADEHDHGEHDHGGLDPHIWLDPKKAIGQVENIRDGLIAADPEGADIYTQNAANFIDDLEALDDTISQTLAPYAGQTFVTYHDFADHFAASYGLEVEHLVGISEDNAAPADVQRVIETVKASELKTLLDEPQQESSQFEAIAADLNISISEFDPLETSPASASTGTPTGDDYLTTMQQNAENLSTAFSTATQP